MYLDLRDTLYGPERYSPTKRIQSMMSGKDPDAFWESFPNAVQVEKRWVEKNFSLQNEPIKLKPFPMDETADGLRDSNKFSSFLPKVSS